MGLARCWCTALVGVSGQLVEIEAHLAAGMVGFTLVGLPDASLAEAKDRVRAAMCSSGEPLPQRRLTVGLSPAALPKRGSHFDLAVALAIAAADGRLAGDVLGKALVLGELGLDGRVRPVTGVLPMVLTAADHGLTRVLVPEPNVAEARLVPGVDVLGARSLPQVLALLRGEPEPPCTEPVVPAAVRVAGDEGRAAAPPDLADVAGQHEARRAVEIAAAGQHHLLLHGPPGTGKTMLARRLPGLLPDLTPAQALEVSAIHSVAGTLPSDAPLLRRPPLADPHHTASTAAIVGGGSGRVLPGAASLAHRGVLFLDEAPEFGPRILDALRQPLELGEVLVARSGSHVRFPARFLLVLAANPCPCGQHGSRAETCQCTPDVVRRYQQRLSGPLRDRLDLRCLVARPARGTLLEDPDGEATASVAERVGLARERQARRLAGTPWRLNGEVPGPDLRKRHPLGAGAAAALQDAYRRGELTARGADRVLRVSWTVADLAGRDRPGSVEVGEALAFRQGRAR